MKSKGLLLVYFPMAVGVLICFQDIVIETNPISAGKTMQNGHRSRMNNNILVGEPLIISRLFPVLIQWTRTKSGNAGAHWAKALEIHWSKCYLHEISNDPSNTLGSECTTSPIFSPSSLWTCNLRWLGESWGTHLRLPLGQPLLSGPLVNVIRVTSLEGYSGHGPLTKADLPTNSPLASTCLFKMLKKKKKVSYLFFILRFSLIRKHKDL